MTVIFWASMATLAGFIFEFGRRLDVKKYPIVFTGLVTVLAGGFWLIASVGKERLPIPPAPVVLILAGFAVMAGHYLWSEFKAWRWPRPFIERRKPANTHRWEDDGDLTRTIRSTEKPREPMASRGRVAA